MSTTLTNISSDISNISNILTATKDSLNINENGIELNIDRTYLPYKNYDKWQLINEECKKRDIKMNHIRNLPKTAIDSFYFSYYKRLNEQFIYNVILKRSGDYCVWLNYDYHLYLSIINKNGVIKHLRIVKTDESYSLLNCIGFNYKTLKDLIFNLYVSPMNILSVATDSDVEMKRLIGPDLRSSGNGVSIGKMFLKPGLIDNDKQLINQTRKHKIYESKLFNKKVTILTSLYNTIDEFDSILYELAVCEYIKEKTLKSSSYDSNDLYYFIHSVSLEEELISKIYLNTKYGQLTQYLEDNNNNIQLIDKIECLLQISWALAELHRLNIIHCNIRTKSIFVDKKNDKLIFLLGGFDNCKITNFSLSKHQSNPYINHHLRIIPPEVFSQMNFTKQSDVYSFGILSWEIFTGIKHLNGENNRNIVLNSFFGEPKRFEYNSPNKFSARIMELVNQCCSGDVSKRPTMNGAWLTLTNIMHKNFKNN